ncbi:hypothetical protein KDW_56860 [Dictyobacter vulcani]|uniref:Uncharacterized protein n=1 Tax=Dictyobacter vulcani TaxID=2607529 RepID=A0A5J4KQ69_9CHLR|nr:PAC2 family protein [Dictyobacter vulcani]GER91524.1 hypothetical protein KDW_56860 [Dictyobacter vulcani]
MTVPITGASADNEIMERLREMEVHNSGYEGPTGMVGILHDACQRVSLSSATLWAAAPHYLAATPNIKVTAALLTYLNQFLSFGLDLHEIQSDAVRFEEQVSALVAKDPEAREYVRRLEEQVANGDDDDDEDEDDDELDLTADPDRAPSSGPLPSADSLIRDVEALLREQRGNGQEQDSDEQDEHKESE